MHDFLALRQMSSSKSARNPSDLDPGSSRHPAAIPVVTEITIVRTHGRNLGVWMREEIFLGSWLRNQYPPETPFLAPSSQNLRATPEGAWI